MEIILLSLACVLNSAAIILLSVSLIRGNRRGKGPSISDLRRADALQHYYESVVNAKNPFDVFKAEDHD